MKSIELTKGLVAVVDDEDFERLSDCKWSASHGYAFNARKGFMHRFIMNAPKGSVVDHINMNTLDNRRNNLRICSRQQNSMNCKPRSDRKNKSERCSSFKGVAWKKQTQKWQANITVDGKYKHLGYYMQERDAALAYNHAAVQFHGEYARLNSL